MSVLLSSFDLITGTSPDLPPFVPPGGPSQMIRLNFNSEIRLFMKLLLFFE
ncbi:MAG TPA: hypothetical protein VMV77_00755 [Bacteroidales bacterium]|nr:hypothetical protein [Bacteroidales bacterium]